MQIQELNIIIHNKYLTDNYDLINHLFGDEKYEILSSSHDMYDLLFLVGAFPSKSEARRNWKKTDREIPFGYNEFKNIGKQRKALYIWNPLEVDLQQYIDQSNEKHKLMFQKLANDDVE